MVQILGNPMLHSGNAHEVADEINLVCIVQPAKYIGTLSRYFLLLSSSQALPDYYSTFSAPLLAAVK